MQDFLTIFDNHILIVALLACLAAQVLKVLFELVRNGKATLKTLTETGGMPSSHSALVAALATGVGQTQGWSSSEFAIAFVVAVIVMYDASGVRQAAGNHARILNLMVDELFSNKPDLVGDRLKELLGHTPLQVLVGSILGVAVSWIAAPAY
ncbi:MAG: divergent PAP2 family protein [Cyanobacteria bacterium P01_E01_bin.6]